MHWVLSPFCFIFREKKPKQKLKKRLKDKGWKERELCSKICRKGLKGRRYNCFESTERFLSLKWWLRC